MSGERAERASRGPLVLLGIAGAFAAAVAAAVAFQAPLPPPARAGSLAPSLALRDLEGRTVDVAGYRGQVLFVNFWATWCPPCRDEAPSLERLYRSFGGEGFAVLAVSIDDAGAASDVRAFRDEFELRFPILLDPGKTAYEAFGVTGVPETFLIDPEGRVVERFIGPRNWDEPRYIRVVRQLLARRPDPGGAPGASTPGAS